MPELFLVAIRCPQCGAETDFPEGAHALACAYCGVTLRVLGAHRGGLARFAMLPTVDARGLAPILQAHTATTGRPLDSLEWCALVFAPFWRARGMALRWAYTRPGGPSLGDLRAASGPGPAAPRHAPPVPATRTGSAAGRRPGRAGLGAALLGRALELVGRMLLGSRPHGATVLDHLVRGEASVPDGRVPDLAGAPERPAHDQRHFLARHVDVSFPAFAGADLGLVSLGVRPGARPLRVLAPDVLPPGARALPLAVDAEAALERAAASAFPEAAGTAGDVVIERRAAITASLSAIYFPFWAASAIVGGRERLLVVDAVAGTVVREGEPSEGWFADLPARQAPVLSAGSLGFLPLRCPECAWALPLEASAVAHLCTHCGRAWAEGRDRLERVEYDAVPARGPAVYLPAWRFEATITVEGRRLAGASEMARLVKPVGWPQAPRADGGEAEPPPALYVPAFECRALTVLERLASALARLQPRVEPGPHGPDGSPLPLSPTPHAVGAAVEEADARALAQLFLVGLVAGAGPAARRRILSLSADLGPGRLVWLPTHDRGSYLQDRLTGVSLPKASLGWAKDGEGR